MSLNLRIELQDTADEMYKSLTIDLLEKWYPLAIDNKWGGYLTNFSYDWTIKKEQEKMIVTQARHIWTLSKAYNFLNEYKYKKFAVHGFDFLKTKMWDNKYGGFYQVRNRDGSLSQAEGWLDEKRTYGNAFAIYGLAALHEITNDDNVLDFAKKVFYWIEKHAFDKKLNGYFQFLTHESIPFDKNSEYKTKATDEVETGYKDQNSSIHLMEAYTELYSVWKDEYLTKQLKNILYLIRDRMVEERGYLRLFFENDLTPLSFRNSPKEIREKNYRLDHVSFGHDYETAFLMLEASHALGLENDITTLSIAKKMLDHAIKNGWDKNSAGFFDEGYYFAGETKCSIIKDTKNWWAQAEGLNALLLFSKIFPEENIYYEYFLKLWEYVKKYLIDKEYGDWYWGSLEKEPFYKTGQKGNIWKGTYHNGRALMNCVTMLADENFISSKKNSGLKRLKQKSDEFINHWQETAKEL